MLIFKQEQEEIIGIFPKPIMKLNIGREFTKSELKVIYHNLKENNQNPRNISSKNKSILEDPKLKDLKDFCDQSVDTFSKKILKYINVDFRICSSWANKTVKDGSHHNHFHANSVFSGVLYIQTDESNVFFEKDRPFNSFAFEIEEYNIFNSYNWSIPVNIGDLIIFKSDIMHGVSTIKEKERISIAFNTFPKTPFGSKERAIYVS